MPRSTLDGEQSWPTQPIPVWPPAVVPQEITEENLTDRTPEAHAEALHQFRQFKSASLYSPPSKSPTLVVPGFHGGATWSGGSFDPTRGRLIVNFNNIPFVLQIRDGRFWARYRYGFLGFQRFVDSEQYPAVKPPWGKLVAFDLNRQSIAWDIPLGEYKELSARGIPPTGTEQAGGSIITAGGLVFIGATRDEKFRAIDVDTGRILWQTQLPAGGYATPSAYVANGKEYIVIAAGGGSLPQTRSGDEYRAYALPGPIQ